MGEGVAYDNLGRICLSIGNCTQAIQYHHLSLPIIKELGGHGSEGIVYCNLGNAYFGVGDFQQALDYHERSLDIARKVGDKVAESHAHGNKGNVFFNLGKFKEAVECHNLSLDIAKELGERAAEGRSYTNLGNVYYSVGDFKKGMEYHRLRLDISVALGDRVGEAQACSGIGNAFEGIGDFDEAVKYHKRDLDISQEVGDKAGVVGAACNLGIAYRNSGDIRQAMKYYQQGLDVAIVVGDKDKIGKLNQNLGNLHSDLADFQEAIVYQNRSLDIAKEVGDKAGEGRAYGGLGNAYLQLGEFQQALKFYKLYLSVVREVGDGPGKGRAYHNLGVTCEALGFLDDAAVSYKASLEQFNMVRGLLQSKDEWKISLQNEYQKTYTALWSLLLEQGKIVEALQTVEQEHAQALEDLMVAQYGFDAGQSGGQEARLDDILSCTTSSVVYIAVKENEINLWILQDGQDTIFKRTKVDVEHFQGSTANDLTSLVNESVAAICPRFGRKCEDRSLDYINFMEGDLLREEESEEEFVPSPEISSESRSSDDEVRPTPQNRCDRLLRTLYNITVAPIAGQIQSDELIIVPDGPLFLAPFAAFLDSNSRYLSESFRIRVLPSLNSLKLIVDAPPDYHCSGGALIVGDPCVEEIVRKKGRRLVKVLQQLPNAREEAKMIGRILNTTPLIGEKATKQEVLKRLSKVAMVHIAAHGNSKTGEIALAPDPKRNSKIPEIADYMLTMAEVLSVGLGARLVVLSCCNSGRGEIKAEGVVGIARAFLGAGARSVLVSLWAIDDEATLEFMRSFYEQLVDGKRVSQALNQAIQCMRQSQKFNAVKYWAPFVLVGDDVTLDFEEKSKEQTNDE